MGRSKKEKSEFRYEPGETAYYVHGDGSVFEVEVLENNCIVGGIGGASYNLRVLEVVNIEDPNSFRTEITKGLEFSCTKMQAMNAGLSWNITENLEAAIERSEEFSHTRSN